MAKKAKVNILIGLKHKSSDFDRLKGLTAGIGKLGLAAGAAAAAITAATASGLRNIEELSQQVKTSGVESVGRLQAITFAASKYGIQQEKLADILKDVNDKVGDFLATGAGPMKDFFEQIGPKVGVTAEDFKNLSSDEALGLYVDSLQKANLSQAEMTFYMEALASDATALIPVFENSGEAIKQADEILEGFGLKLDSVDEAAVNMANNSLRQIGIVSQGVGQQLAAELAPEITAVAEALLGNGNGLGHAVETVARFISEGLVVTIGTLMDAWQGLQIVVKKMEVSFLTFFEVILRESGKFGEMLFEAIEGAVKSAIESINKAIRAFNIVIEKVGGSAIPEIDFEFSMPDPKELTQAVAGAVDAAEAELKKLEDAPFASEAFVTVFNQKIFEIEQAAEKMAEAEEKLRKTRIDPALAAPESPNQPGSPALLRPEFDGFEGNPYLTPFSNAFTELDARHEQELERLSMQRDQVNQLYINKELEKQAALRAIEQEEQARRFAYHQAQKQILVSSVSGVFGELAENTKAFAGEQSAAYKAMFIAQKSFAVVDATMKTYQAAVGAYNAMVSIPYVGPFIAPVAAGAAVAAGMINVARITGLTYGGGYYGGGLVRGGEQLITVNEKDEEFVIPGDVVKAFSPGYFESNYLKPPSRSNAGASIVPSGGAGGEDKTKVIVVDSMEKAESFREQESGLVEIVDQRIQRHRVS